jgi:hypothetical protein
MLRWTCALACALTLAALPAAARAQIAVVGDAVQEREAPPHASYDGAITIRNTGVDTQEARIYQTDYRFQADGQTSYDRPGSLPRSNATWITVSPSRVVVPAGESVEVRYRVTVPAAADTLSGSYWSLVMVEGLASPAGSLAPERRGVAVQTTVRYAVQIVTHVGATGAPRVGFAGTASSAPDGTRALSVDLTNVGDRAGRLQLTLELFAEDGRQIATLRQARGLVYPGTSIRQRFALGALPSGSYKALLVADAGGDAVFGAQYTLRF